MYCRLALASTTSHACEEKSWDFASADSEQCGAHDLIYSINYYINICVIINLSQTFTEPLNLKWLSDIVLTNI